MSEVPRQIALAACAIELQKALRARADDLNMPREVIDAIAGFTDGYASKLLADPPVKGMSLDSMLVLAGTLGMGVALVDDPNALERTRRHKDYQERRAAWLKRKAPHWRNAKALGMMLEMAVKYGSEGGRATFENMTAKQRTKHQARAARARWRKWRRERRERERAQASARRAEPASGSPA